MQVAQQARGQPTRWNPILDILRSTNLINRFVLRFVPRSHQYLGEQTHQDADDARHGREHHQKRHGRADEGLAFKDLEVDGVERQKDRLGPCWPDQCRRKRKSVFARNDRGTSPPAGPAGP